jgi:glycine betaine/choline ABC-type transport system substrate-binding protein
VIPPYDAVLLVAPQRAGDTALLAALKPLNNAIDVTLMREANLRVSKGEAPEQVARWMAERIALRGK